MESLPEKRVSFVEYQTWNEDQRWEIIDGHPYAMSSPSLIHQTLSIALGHALFGHFKGQPCAVFSAPLDVRLSDFDVVQPDLLVVCDQKQLNPGYVDGPPTLVIEILSPSTMRHDRIRKARLYAAAGVKEYWLVHPSPAMIEICLLDGETYRLVSGYTDMDTLSSPTFPELSLDLSDIFPFEEVDEVREGRPPAYVAREG
jgi:Uma2 family endonuclease